MGKLTRYWWAIGLLLAVGIALLSPLASSHPDGLERVAEDLGFLDRAEYAPYEGLPSYAVPGIESPVISTIMVGLIGTLLLFGLSFGLAWLMRRRSERATDDPQQMTDAS